VHPGHVDGEVGEGSVAGGGDGNAEGGGEGSVAGGGDGNAEGGGEGSVAGGGDGNAEGGGHGNAEGGGDGEVEGGGVGEAAGGGGGAAGGGGEGGGDAMRQDPSSEVAVESKLSASVLIQPRMRYVHWKIGLQLTTLASAR